MKYKIHKNSKNKFIIMEKFGNKGYYNSKPKRLQKGGKKWKITLEGNENI